MSWELGAAAHMQSLFQPPSHLPSRESPLPTPLLLVPCSASPFLPHAASMTDLCPYMERFRYRYRGSGLSMMLSGISKQGDDSHPWAGSSVVSGMQAEDQAEGSVSSTPDLHISTSRGLECNPLRVALLLCVVKGALTYQTLAGAPFIVLVTGWQKGKLLSYGGEAIGACEGLHSSSQDSHF